MLEARAARRAAISVTVDVVMWLSVALKAVLEGGNQISIDELTATNTFLYGSVSALYVWGMSSKAKNFGARVTLSCFQVMPFTAVVICRCGNT